MRALSLWQPWATLCAIGAKQYETRSWGTSYRGPLVIHAAKTTFHLNQLELAIFCCVPSDMEHFHTWPAGSFNYYAIQALYTHADQPIGSFIPKLPLGAALGTVELVGCWEMTPTYIARFSEQEIAFGNWQPGRFAWQFINPQPFDKPIPMRGMQGLFSVDLQALTP